MGKSILLVSHGFQPNYEKAFANGLASVGLEIELVTSDRSLVLEFHPQIKAINLRGSQDSCRPGHQKILNIVRYAVVLFRHIRRGRYDVVHLIGLFMVGNKFANLLELSIYRLSIKRFFMTVHNLLPHNKHTLFNRWFYWAIYRFPDKLVVHTEKMKRGLCEQFGVEEARVVVMRHGVDAPPARLSVPNYAPELRVLVFGGLSHYKGTDLLLESLQYCSDIPIVIWIAGECRDMAYEARIDNLVKKLPSNIAVHWERKFIDEQQVASYFESADVAVLPYRHIDQSGVLFTAFRFGTPVIASDVGSFRESVPPYAGIVVPALTAEALAESLRTFRARKHEFDRLRIRQFAESLSWPLTVVPLIEAYKSAKA